jgi:hypothetical protein
MTWYGHVNISSNLIHVSVTVQKIFYYVVELINQ